MICPFCLSDYTDVFNSRPSHSQSQVWRRRRCLECQNNFTTYERVDLKFIKINTKAYKKAKLYQSVLAAFEQSSGNLNQVDDVVDSIEMKIIRLPNSSVSSEDIINLVLNTLKSIDNRAFLYYLAKHAPNSEVRRIK